MTNKEEYLATIGRWLWLYEEDDKFTKFLRSELKTVVETEELTPIDETKTILSSSDVNLIDVFKASGIWFIYMTRRLYPNTPLYHVIKDFKVTPALTIVSTGWIRKNVEANGDYRTAILTHPICDDIENLWRFYDVANITFMDTTGVPMILLNDRELPLTAIHGFQQKCIFNTDSALEVEYVDTALFAFRANDTDTMAERRIRLTLALTYFTFTAYPQATLKWFEKDKGIPVFPDDILADALIVANHMMEDKGMPEFTKDINDYTDEYIDSIVKMAEGIIVADDLMKRFKHVQVKLHNLYNFTWACVKKASVIKPDENK